MTDLERHPLQVVPPKHNWSKELSEYWGHRPDKYYKVRPTDVIMSKYKVANTLGYGSSGLVIRAQDRVTGTFVAVKILHHVDDDSQSDQQAREMRMYQKLLAGCDPRIELFAAVLGAGMHKGFSFVVFELLDVTLYDVIRGFCGLTPLPGRQLVEIVYQMVQGVEYLHTLGIIHTDLKPDNVALRSSKTVNIQWLDPVTGFHDKAVLISTRLCILDLGCAVDTSAATHSGRIGVRRYRAPEITLGLPWTCNVDNFSLGCIIAELYLMGPFFPNELESDRQHLAIMEAILGYFPEDYARRVEERCPGTFTFDSAPRVQFPSSGSACPTAEEVTFIKRVEKQKPLAALIYDSLLCDLIEGLTAADSYSRLSMRDASKHRYFDVLGCLQWQ
ncbi:kinase-like domain-containing protein [Earliella scabrosa]|nr:kinase-like domain-containing protein [Earliella scabrosa]